MPEKVGVAAKATLPGEQPKRAVPAPTGIPVESAKYHGPLYKMMRAMFKMRGKMPKMKMGKISKPLKKKPKVKVV
jgi:hypothetical protein